MSKARIGGVGEDRISLLPESLLCHILSFLTTRESVRTSVLSSVWRDLWLWVPRLDVDKSDFSEDSTCLSFIDKFLTFRSESNFLSGFKFNTDHDVYDNSTVEACLARVVRCKIQHFEIENYFEFCRVEMPLFLSICDTLVSLKLTFVTLSAFDSCPLPYLRVLHLENVIFPGDEAAQALISCSPVLEEFELSRSPLDTVLVLRVCSQSLKTVTLKRARMEPVYVANFEHRVVINTPRLEYLNLNYYQYKSFEIVNARESVKVDIDVLLSDRNIVSFLTCVSDIRDLTISRRILEVIFRYLEVNRGFKFHNLARLRSTMFSNSSPEMLPIILESCPNLKQLTLELVHDSLAREGMSRLLTVLPSCLVSSLESVYIKSSITRKATELKLVRYILENSTALRKLVLRLNQSSKEKHEPGALKRLVESPRRSSLCQLVIL